MAQRPAFIRWSREKEARVQSRLLDALEGKFQRDAAKAIEVEMTRLASVYRSLGYVPAVSDDHQRQMRDVYRALALASARTFGKRIVTQGKSAGLILEAKQDEDEGVFSRLFRSLASAWVSLEPVRRRIQSVTDTTRQQVTNIVGIGQRDGLGVDAIAKRIADEAPRISRQRGALIARTETHGAANFAMHETAKSTGLELVKEWVSVEDTRTRALFRDDKFDHFAMDGQVRDMDEPFDMPWIGGGGQPLKIMYPGEAGKPGGAVINCRCASIHKVKGLD